MDLCLVPVFTDFPQIYVHVQLFLLSSIRIKDPGSGGDPGRPAYSYLVTC